MVIYCANCKPAAANYALQGFVKPGSTTQSPLKKTSILTPGKKDANAGRPQERPGLYEKGLHNHSLIWFRHVVHSGEEGPAHWADHHLGGGSDSSPWKETSEVLRAGSGVPRGWLWSQHLPCANWVPGLRGQDSLDAAMCRSNSSSLRTTTKALGGESEKGSFSIWLKFQKCFSLFCIPRSVISLEVLMLLNSNIGFLFHPSVFGGMPLSCIISIEDTHVHPQW